LCHETEKASETNLLSAVQNLKNAPYGEIVAYTPIIFDELFAILCRDYSDESYNKKIFNEITALVSLLCSEPQLKRSNSLQHYIKYRFKMNFNWARMLFEEILKNWLFSFKEIESSATKETTRIGSFYFDIMTKAIYEHIKSNNVLGKQYQFKNDIFIANLKAFVPELSQDIIRRSRTGVSIGKELNEGLAVFLCNCFPFLDRFIVFELIAGHINAISKQETEVLIGFKYDFLRIICAYEHYIPLNAPINSQGDVKFEKIVNIQKEFWKMYYLNGLLLSEVRLSLEHPSSEVRCNALITLKDVLCKLDLDARYKDVEMKRRIALMFFPFVVEVNSNLKYKLDE
jgi:hypothetical protein